MAAVKQHELGTPVADIVRKLRGRRADILPLEKQHGGLEATDVRELSWKSWPHRPRPLRQRARASPGDGLRLGQREGRFAGARHALGRRPRLVGEDGRGADSDGRKRLVFDEAIRYIPKPLTTSATVNVGPGSTCPTLLFVA